MPSASSARSLVRKFRYHGSRPSNTAAFLTRATPPEHRTLPSAQRRLFSQHQHQHHYAPRHVRSTYTNVNTNVDASARCPHGNHHHRLSKKECGCSGGGARHFHSNATLLANRNPYEVMGLPRDASKDDVKRKFKELAKKYHPDVCKDPNAKEKFAELNSAYQILNDDEKRQIFDQTGSTEAAFGDMGEGGGPFGGGGAGFHSAEDIFNQFFGGGGGGGGGHPFADMFGGGGGGGSGGRSPQPERGENMRRSTVVSLEEVAAGSVRDLVVDQAVKCEPCGGKGKNPKTKPKKCTTCGGSGRITVQQMMFVMQTSCNSCGGTGRVQDPCPSCNGNGHNMERKKFEVVIPMGVEDGHMLRMSGMGKPGYNGGPPGDLLFEIKVRPHPRFRRRGNNLEVDAEVSLAHAVLGGEIQVALLNGGETTIKVQPGTQHGDTQVVKGLGLAQKTGRGSSQRTKPPGNLIVHFKIKVPKKLTSEQQKLFEEYAKTEGPHNYGHASSSSNSWWKSWPFHHTSA